MREVEEISSNPSSKELVLKIILVGAPKSGKTSLVRRLCDKPFREEYVPTLGFDVIVVPYGTYQGRPVSLQLWDVAGSQLNARPCHHGLIGQRAEGVLYVLDVTSRESLQAIDDWDRALSSFLPPWSCKLLVGHKADLPVYVVNDEALSLYVEGANGFRGWCLTVGSSDYGDYDVAARRGGGGPRDSDGRYKGQSLSGEKQLSVSEAVRTLVGHVFRLYRPGDAGGPDRARPAGVLGLGASASEASPLPSSSLSSALETVAQLGLGLTAQAPPGTAGGADKKNRGRTGAHGKEGDFGMKELLCRGRGPGASWQAAAAARGSLGGGGGSEKGGSAIRLQPYVDPGWNYFAGRMGREEAEVLLRGRPEGTFFLRRKSPTVLVLTYVASGGGGGRAGGSGGSRKGQGGASPRPIVRPQQRGGAPFGGEGTGGRSEVDSRRSGSYSAAEDATFVQHALLVYEDGCFGDEKGRLGRFATLEELLKSKISAIARYPLSFRRERDRYVLVEPATDTTHGSAKTPVDRAQSSPRGSSPPSTSPTNPFAPVLQALAAGNPFRAQPVSPLGSPNAPASIPSSLPLALPDATGFKSAGRDRRSSPHSSTGSAASGGGGCELVDKRVKTKPGGISAMAAAASGGSLWMEAAAAVQKSMASSSTTSTGGKTRRRNTRGNSSARTTGYGMGGGKMLLDSDGRLSRQRSRKGSVSSNEDGSVSSSAAESADMDNRTLQQRRSDGGCGGGSAVGESAMAKAAEAAAASAAAAAATAAHPKAKIALERMLAVEAKVDVTTETVELELRPLARQSRLPAAAPAAAAAAVGARQFSRGSPLSSPRGSMSPMAPKAADNRWLLPAEARAASMPRLDAAAALLIDRAWSSRHAVLDSVNALRERTVKLTVVEMTEAAQKVRSVSPPPQDRRWPSDSRKRVVGPVTPKKFDGANRIVVGTPRVCLKGSTPRGAQTASGSDFSTPPTAHVGLGLSTCKDFDRILGDDYEATLPEAETTQQRREDVGGSSAATERIARPVFSDAGVRCSDFYLKDPARQKSWSGGAGSDSVVVDGPALERHQSGSPIAIAGAGPCPSSWEAIFSDLDVLEERCGTFVTDWKETAAIMVDSCRDEDCVVSCGEGAATQ